MTDPLVSVIIAVRDSERFVESAVRSALAQTYPSLDIVVVDDGSVDRTSEVLSGIRDARLRVLRTTGIGAGGARNIGIRATSGTYVALLDGDDLWDRTKIAAHVSVMASSPDVDLTFCHSRFIDQDGAPISLPLRRPHGSYDFESLLRDNIIGNGSAVVVRRSAIPPNGFDEALNACIDYELWLRIALIRPGNVLCVPDVLTAYRRHPGQLTADWRRMQQAWESLIAKMRELAAEATARAEPAARANWYRYLSFVAYEQGEEGEAIRLLMQSFRARPSVAALNPRTWLLASAIVAGALIPNAMRPSGYGLRRVSRKVT